MIQIQKASKRFASVSYIPGKTVVKLPHGTHHVHVQGFNATIPLRFESDAARVQQPHKRLS